MTLAPPRVPPRPIRRFDLTAAHKVIQEILFELYGCVSPSDFPDWLDFQPLHPNGQIPRLADTRRRAPLKEHRRQIGELLGVLNYIRSHRDEGIQSARADAVECVKVGLYEMKRKRAVKWDNVSRRFTGILYGVFSLALVYIFHATFQLCTTITVLARMRAVESVRTSYAPHVRQPFLDCF